MTATEDRTARGEWLEWRSEGIGASDVAAILGLSPWASPYTVWLDKTGQRADEDNEAMEAGRMLEPAIGPWFTARTGLYVIGEQTWCAHPERSWARATVDGFVVESPMSTIPDTLGPLEVKTTSDPPKKWEADGIPPYYAAQGQWQMFVTDTPRVWFAVLHASHGLRLRIYELERDDDDIAFMRDRCERFWFDHVQTATAPPVDGHDATTEALKEIGADPDADTVDLDADPAVTQALLALPLIKERLARVEQEKAAAENAIRAALGGAVAGVSAHAKSVTWKPQVQNRVDTAALRERLPRVAARFTTTTEIRVLRITAKKEAA